MNYLNVYCNLIRKAENRTPPEGYTEKHHTFPKSIFGKNNRIVVLTAREHYIAHALLERICIKRYGLNHYKTQKMTYAFWCMNSQKSKNTYLNSNLYESSRIRISGENNIAKNTNIRKKISQKLLGENNPSYGKKWWNDGHGNIKLSKECPGINWVLGTGMLKIASEETKQKLREHKIKYLYEIKNPEGEIYTTNNLNYFCKSNGLDSSAMYKVCSGKQRQHKGWTVRILEHLT
jgi:hypothetical protein